MGRDLYLDTKIITKEEFEDFKNGNLYINKYDLTFLKKEEIETKIKIFLFNFLKSTIEKLELKDLIRLLTEYKDENIDFYSYCKEYYKDYSNEDEWYNWGYDEDIFECYINYDVWINLDDNKEDYIVREVEEIENSIILIQSYLM